MYSYRHERKNISLEKIQYTAQSIADMRLDQNIPISEQEEAYKRIASTIHAFLSAFEVRYGATRTIGIEGHRFPLSQRLLYRLDLLDPRTQERMDRVDAMDRRESSYHPWISFYPEGEDGYTALLGYAGRHESYNQMYDAIERQGGVQENTLLFPRLPMADDVALTHEVFYENEWNIYEDSVVEAKKRVAKCQFYVRSFDRDFPLFENLDIPLAISNDPSPRGINRLLVSVFSRHVDFEGIE